MKRWKIVLGMTTAVLALGVSSGYSTDLSKIIQKAKANYVDAEIEDMAVVSVMKTDFQETEGMNPEKEKLFQEMFGETEMKTWRKGVKYKIDMERVVMLYDGKDSWLITSIFGKQKLSTEEGKPEQSEWNWWDMISEEAEIVGTEIINKRECLVIKNQIGELTGKMWVDQKDVVLVKLETEEDEDVPQATLVFSDHRNVKGDWKIPYKIESYIDGELKSAILVQSVRINQGLSDDLFDPDKVEVKDDGQFSPEKFKEMMEKKEGKN